MIQQDGGDFCWPDSLTTNSQWFSKVITMCQVIITGNYWNLWLIFFPSRSARCKKLTLINKDYYLNYDIYENYLMLYYFNDKLLKSL